MSTSQTAPAVYFAEDICRVLGLSRRTLDRLLRHGAFPIPQLPRLDRRHRWSAAKVEAFLQEEQGQLSRHGRTVRRHAFGGKVKALHGERSSTR